MHKIIHLSDTHKKHRQVEMPLDQNIDTLIHSGDITANGEMSTMEDFAAWLKELPYANKIVVAGNHDRCFEVRDKTHQKSIRNREAAIKMLTDAGAIYLEHESITIDGVRIFGSPYSPEFFNWAFNVRRGEKLKEKWAAIPDDVALLITHGPPYGILDEVPRGIMQTENVGCQDLLNRIQELPNLRAHLFGHIHHSYGTKQVGKVQYINAAICTENYNAINKPVIFEINPQ